jgi:predicted metal-dependent phosphoesterase TrpH
VPRSHGTDAAAPGPVTRGAGHARDTQEAFDRWLNRDKAGHVPAEWPAFAAAMAVLRDSGAIAVLAHPHRYRLSAASCAS